MSKNGLTYVQMVTPEWTNKSLKASVIANYRPVLFSFVQLRLIMCHCTSFGAVCPVAQAFDCDNFLLSGHFSYAYLLSAIVKTPMQEKSPTV